MQSRMWYSSCVCIWVGDKSVFSIYFHSNHFEWLCWTSFLFRAPFAKNAFNCISDHQSRNGRWRAVYIVEPAPTHQINLRGGDECSTDLHHTRPKCHGSCATMLSALIHLLSVACAVCTTCACHTLWLENAELGAQKTECKSKSKSKRWSTQIEWQRAGERPR